MTSGAANRDATTRRAVLATGAAIGLTATAGCLGSTQPADDTETATATPFSDSIRIAGSSTVYPLTLRVAAEFTKRHPDANIDLASTGTGGGFADFFCLGESDINDASRPISREERAKCSAHDVEFLEFQVATDALTVVVSPDNDWCDCLTPNELKRIWHVDGATEWQAVRSEWPAVEIEHYGPTSDSGTYDYFAEEIIGSVEAHRTDYAGTEQDSTIIRNVQASRSAIGYLGFAYYTQNADSVRALAIDDGTGCVEPALETAESGAYSPLSRPLFIYVNRDSLRSPTVQAFLEYYLDQIDTSLVSSVGYVPLDSDTAARNRESLETALDQL